MVNHGIISLFLVTGLIVGVCLVAGCLENTADGQLPISPSPGESDDDLIIIGTGDQIIDTCLSDGLHLLTFNLKKPADSYPDDSMVEIMTGHTGVMIRGSFTNAAYEAAEDDGWYSWSQVVMLPETANATVTVRQKGDWSLTLHPPAMINGIPPQTFTGIGNAATPFFMIPAGDYSCEISIEEGTFIGVHLIRYDGTILMYNDQVAPLAMHGLRDNDDECSVGNYTSTVPVTIHDYDNYLFNIISDGIWSVTISPM